MKRLTWLFELLERMSGPARRASGALADLDKKTRQAAGDTDKLTKKTKGLGDQTKKTGDGFGWMGTKIHGWLSTMRMAWSAVSGLTGGLLRLGYGFTKAGLDAASFKESTGMGLEVLLGSKGQADALLRQGVRFAAVTPFGTKDTMRWLQDLTGAGFRGQELWQALSAAGDVAALRGGDPQVTDRIINVFRQIKGKRRLQAEELMQLAEVGLPIGKVWDVLAERTGIDAMELQSPKNAGRISADLGIWAVEETIRRNISGGTLGNLMKRQSGTVSGLLSTLESRPFEWMMDLDKSAGFVSFKKALENLVNVLDPATPAGQRIKKNVEHLFDGIMGGLFKQFEDPKKVEEFINKLLSGFQQLVPTIGRLAENLGKVADKLGAIVQYVGFLTDPGKTLDTLGGAALDAVLGKPQARPVVGKKGIIVGEIARLRALKAAGKLPEGLLFNAPAFRSEIIEQGLFGDPASLAPYTNQKALDFWEGEAKRLKIVIPDAPSAPGDPAANNQRARDFWDRASKPAEPAPAPAAPAKTSYHFGPRAFEGMIQVNGAKEPKAVAEETAEALALVFDRLGAQAGVG